MECSGIPPKEEAPFGLHRFGRSRIKHLKRQTGILQCCSQSRRRNTATPKDRRCLADFHHCALDANAAGATVHNLRAGGPRDSAVYNQAVYNLGIPLCIIKLRITSGFHSE